VLALAYLREGETFANLPVGFGVGAATAWRYARETVTLLAAARKIRHAFMVIEGTLIPIDRVAASVGVRAAARRRP
jgi:hypothetical protein